MIVKRRPLLTWNISARTRQPSRMNQAGSAATDAVTSIQVTRSQAVASRDHQGCIDRAHNASRDSGSSGSLQHWTLRLPVLVDRGALLRPPLQAALSGRHAFGTGVRRRESDSADATQPDVLLTSSLFMSGQLKRE